ncbi:MAG: hypothetical protein KDA90_03420 [Planctomycetaceae bacterium]|nr:hypothetical protein [Planctomycetaceae bacterium]
MSDYRPLLESFARAIQERAAAEQTLQDTFGHGPDSTEQELFAAAQRAETERATELESLARQQAAAEDEIDARCNTDLSELQSAQRALLHQIESRASGELTSLEQQKSDSSWVVTSVLDDTADDSPKREFERFKSQIHKLREEQIAEWTDIDQDFKAIVEERRWSGPPPIEPEQAPKSRDMAQQWFGDRVRESRELLQTLRGLLLPRLFMGLRSLILFFVLACTIAIPFFLFVQPLSIGASVERLTPTWVAISGGAGAVGSLLLTLIIYTLASMQQSEVFRQLQQSTAEASWLHQLWLGMARDDLNTKQVECERRQKRMVREREEQLQRFEETHLRRRQEIEQRREQEHRNAVDTFEARRQALENQRNSEKAAVRQTYQEQSRLADQRTALEVQQRREALTQYSRERQRRQMELWIELKSAWEQSYSEFQQGADRVNAEAAQAFRPWNELAEQWQSAKTIPPLIPFGHYDVDLNNWPSAISEDMRLAPRITQHRLPATLTFPERASVLFRTPDSASRTEAVAAMQTLALRLLTLLPPGKLRFTIIDPIGLGESFAGLMHLTDFDELMVTSRIWTEPGQIETQLADLTEHMENVLQKYLRNEFQTIEEYNAAAGEVAEPYHFLIISDFPAKFSDIAARRLVSIINSGPRCGVYTLLSVDPTKQLPHNFNIRDIESAMERFQWHEGAFHAEREDTAYWPVRVNAPPSPELFTRLVRRIGEASKDARRVEVSFSRIAPAAGAIWSQDSRRELEIPLGRAGATKLQRLKLGRGTSQHMLVAGKTGSGKSTFLHILITNLALHYSPDEVNFYLIDFKKGVEFKDYATLRLPHARVIAIESDREFGISTLQKLDAVLQERGELFRKHGVQDIAGFRNANPQTPLPRILLIVDEFQEFFIEDDKLSQSASLLLDRLVRQGRAFGMHVVLGSQTLGGAYSLARSTLGQVAVRVALQCSEADSHLILSEENTAARLLTRPGEAIYNDANGLSEGNHPFQIAWLEDEEREQYLQQILQRTQRQGLHMDAPIVFEGNIPSKLSLNNELHALISKFGAREQPLTAPTVWLGDAVEISPPSAITFHRQSGSHVLLVGQDAEAAQGIMGAALLTWAASETLLPSAPIAYLFDGAPPDTPESSEWKRLLEAIPLPIRHVAPRDTSTALNELHELLTQRETDPTAAHPPLLVPVFNIAKFRDLRKGEDDYGMSAFGSSGEAKALEPGQIFSELLKRGPDVGIHAMIWCDSYNNLERWFSRQTLRELEQRIAFQMNANDSSNLIDSPAASRLGTHRALLYREETGTAEKFRPYGLPDDAWLAEYRRHLGNIDEPEIATDLGEFNVL